MSKTLFASSVVLSVVIVDFPSFICYFHLKSVFLQQENKNIMGKTVFNSAQLELLKAMSALNSEEDLFALKKAISEFFAHRVDTEMDRLWESGKWNEDTLKELETAHERTPYQQ